MCLLKLLLLSSADYDMSSATEVLTRKPKNIAIETNPAHELNVVDAEVPEPGPDECLVHVRATGICGSDVHFWKAGGIGDSVIRHDLGLGHESAGVVVKSGSNVSRLKVGTYNKEPSEIVIGSTDDVYRRQSCFGVRYTLLQTHLRSMPHRPL